MDVVEAFGAEKEKCCRAVDVSDYEHLVELPCIGQDEKSEREIENPLRPLFTERRGKVRNCNSGSESKEHVDEKNKPHIYNWHLAEQQNAAGKIDQRQIAAVANWFLSAGDKTDDGSDKDDRGDRKK